MKKNQSKIFKQLQLSNNEKAFIKGGDIIFEDIIMN